MSSKKVLLLEAMLGQRIDKALALDPEIGTRSRAAHLIEKNLVLVNNQLVKNSYVIKATDEVLVHLPDPSPSELVPNASITLDILFEDKDLIVINKPSGLVVHPAAGHESDTLVNALLAHTQDLSMKFGENRPGIVHRLDKETSGILVIAKNDFTHESLAEQFKNRTTHRVYHAVIFGRPKDTKGTLKSYLARHPTDRKRYASVKDKNNKVVSQEGAPLEIGKWAVTHYQVLESTSQLSYIQLKLETGRTHQIRVHLSELGHPILGDILYGGDKRLKGLSSPALRHEISGLHRFLLHATELAFEHPTTKNRLEFKVDWPQQDLSLIKKWGLRL